MVYDFSFFNDNNNFNLVHFLLIFYFFSRSFCQIFIVLNSILQIKFIIIIFFQYNNNNNYNNGHGNINNNCDVGYNNDDDDDYK
jgi:hypothetical protein